MAGLMHYEPDDHYDFLIESLAKVCSIYVIKNIRNIQVFI